MQTKFDINARQFLITYPKCTSTKEEVLSHLQTIHQVDLFTVCEEQHMDGTPHVHAVIKFNSRYHSSNARCFDLGSWHPNIAVCKTRKDFAQASAYARKGGVFITNFEEPQSKRTQLAKKIIAEGRITKELIEKNPEIIFLNYSSISSWLGILPRSIKAIPPLTKKRHYWVFGPSNCGKTYWLRAFTSMFDEPQEIPSNNDFKFVTQSTDLLYMDEYKGDLTVQVLNRLCDGDTLLNTKGGITKIGYPLVCICSNFSISDCYKNSSNEILNTVYNRFHEYDLSINTVPFYKCSL